jgi:hypothetical protein
MTITIEQVRGVIKRWTKLQPMYPINVIVELRMAGIGESLNERHLAVKAMLARGDLVLADDGGVKVPRARGRRKQ